MGFFEKLGFGGQKEADKYDKPGTSDNPRSSEYDTPGREDKRFVKTEELPSQEMNPEEALFAKEEAEKQYAEFDDPEAEKKLAEKRKQLAEEGEEDDEYDKWEDMEYEGKEPEVRGQHGGSDVKKSSRAAAREDFVGYDDEKSEIGKSSGIVPGDRQPGAKKASKDKKKWNRNRAA